MRTCCGMKRSGLEKAWRSAGSTAGGDVTYHGPGQLVGYPLLPLAPPRLGGRAPAAGGFVGYVRSLEKTLIFALARLGVVAGQHEGLTGVWVAADVWARCPRGMPCDPRSNPQPAKIASIGVKVDVHGCLQAWLCTQCSHRSAYWEGIIPCGLEQVQMANLADLSETAAEMAGARAVAGRV